MNDIDFSKLDTHLYDLITNHFQIDLTDEKNLDIYHGFRNDVVELIDDEGIGMRREEELWNYYKR